jgi:hypothetical protein
VSRQTIFRTPLRTMLGIRPAHCCVPLRPPDSGSSPGSPGKLDNTGDVKNGGPLLASFSSSPLPSDSPTPSQGLQDGVAEHPLGRAANTLRNTPSGLPTMPHRNEDICSETTNLHVEYALQETAYILTNAVGYFFGSRGIGPPKPHHS